MKKFNELETRNQLADFLKIPRSLLTYVLYEKRIENLYDSFTIPKKYGGERSINAPIDELKDIQNRLANALGEYYIQILKDKDVKNNISHAFIKGKSIISNATIHRNKRYVLNIDLENFFDSIHIGRVKGYFMKNSNFELPKEVATVIAQLSCYNGSLPQGAPTSPIISNLICNIMDIRLLSVARKYKLDYTRYADDLTFSTNNKAVIEEYDNMFKSIKETVERSGFTINENKTRIIHNKNRQVVTGLTVNQKISVNKDFYKKTRAMANHLYTKQCFYINGVLGTMNQLEGRYSFIDQIDRYNNIKDTSFKHNFKTLNSREKDYQKFLFYKYFIKAQEPLLVTEGKTDVLHLTAAMASLKSNNAGKVSFLKRSKRLKYFFNFQEDGADTLKNIYNMYVGKDNMPNYYNLFINKYCNEASNPIILVFDNELVSKKRPLYKFVNDVVGLSDDKIEELSKTCKVNLIGNLYLVTTPLVKSALESEIEDLYLEETLSHEISEKHFSKKAKIDSEKEYGKAIFANYVFENSEKISFDMFKPMISAIDSIIKEYKKC